VSVVTQKPLVFPTISTTNHNLLLVMPIDNRAGSVAIKALAREKAKFKILDKRVALYAGHGNSKLIASNFKVHGNVDAAGNMLLSDNSADHSSVQIGGQLNVNSNVHDTGLYRGVLHVQVTTNSNAVQAGIPVQVRLLAAATISTIHGMVFPRQLVGFKGRIEIDPDSTGSALFVATGDAGASAVLSVSPNEVKLAAPGTKQNVMVEKFTFYSDVVKINESKGTFNFPKGSGTVAVNDIRVGATAKYPAQLEEGDYHGSAILELVYD